MYARSLIYFFPAKKAANDEDTFYMSRQHMPVADGGVCNEALGGADRSSGRV